MSRDVHLKEEAVSARALRNFWFRLQASVESREKRQSRLEIVFFPLSSLTASVSLHVYLLYLFFENKSAMQLSRPSLERERLYCF